ncbi:HAD family hydrolase [Amnibacterium sp. CER49]|uniref:HAD family hydrolase n=1 Tax=Amnibacterium sp. CER49 TaxID=3039161 RepID=UPI0024490D2C|nr:HAD family hydrolase [Amnibacterium sp. CER49]MDH2445129.1 HAD family hydrolase [Amnibacterium sp. CER49]
MDFLQEVTEGETAVPAEQRLAAFDNDGTLSPEKPESSLTAFLRTLPPAPEMPAATGPAATDAQEQLAARCNGLTVQEFEERAESFLRAARHPALNRTWPTLTYVPMIELLDLLRALEFSVYIVSAGSRDFLRAMAATAFGATREHVIGTDVEIDYREGRLVRTDRLIPRDRGPGKPAHIWDRSGQVPLLAAGNTTGDREMLECARFALLIDHDDAEREYSYRDDQALRVASERGWTTVSMRRDFAAVFREV